MCALTPIHTKSNIHVKVLPNHCYFKSNLYCTAVNGGVTSQIVLEQGVLKKVRDLDTGAGECHQWPLLWTEQSHKQRLYGLLIQQDFIRTLGSMGKALTISFVTNDYFYWRKREEDNEKCNIREVVPCIWQQVPRFTCVSWLLCLKPMVPNGGYMAA